jgi:hypothetical protein
MNHILASFKIESALTAAMREATKSSHEEGVQIAIAHIQDALKMTMQQRISMNARILAGSDAVILEQIV